MKYYIDTEFIEGFHKPLFGKKRHFIDLISIGIVAEDGREYYAISKDFDLEAVWNKYDLKRIEVSGDVKNIYPKGYYMKKVYWLRDNVLKHLFNNKKFNYYENIDGFNGFKNLVNHFGKSNKQIAEEIKDFCCYKISRGRTTGIMDWKPLDSILPNTDEPYGREVVTERTNPEFYGYYADYDWVLFCSLFGRMIDLPKGFPMYCRDLKQMLDIEAERCLRTNFTNEWKADPIIKGDIVNKGVPAFKNIDEVLQRIKSNPNYPKQENEHNALSDAKWNKQLHEFLIKL